MAKLTAIQLPDGTKVDIADKVSGYITAEEAPVTDVEVNGSSVVENGVAEIDVPTNVSDLTNDAGYLTTETDPTVPSWAKQSTKPSYTAAEVGALPDDTFIPTNVSDLVNDEGYISSETDPTVPLWAKAPTKPSYSASEVGALPASTVIPSKTSDLTNDSGYITTETDPTVSAWAKAPAKPSYTANEVGALPSTTVIPSATSDLTNDSGFITSETDPVFTASPAYGITSTDITSWNSKVSDDKTWNGVVLGGGRTDTDSDLWIPAKGDNNLTGTAYWVNTTEDIPNNNYSVNIPRYKKINGTPYLQSSTPSANDNSTKVATTAYVDSAIPIVPTKVSDLTNDSGFITANDVPKEVAFAIYGQTTYTEIYAFSAANKYVVVVDNGKLVPCTISLVGSTVVCSHFENGSEIIYVVTSEGWTSTSTSYATTANLATVATSGSYNDLLNRPTVSNVQIVRWSEENN